MGFAQRRKGTAKIAKKTQGICKAWRSFGFGGVCCTMLHWLRSVARGAVGSVLYFFGFQRAWDGVVSPSRSYGSMVALAIWVVGGRGAFVFNAADRWRDASPDSRGDGEYGASAWLVKTLSYRFVLGEFGLIACTNKRHLRCHCEHGAPSGRSTGGRRTVEHTARTDQACQG
jgi:hypothetical protein